MIDAVRAAQVASKPSSLKIHRPGGDVTNAARWFINGFPATILVWTAEEWSKLTDRPHDAQQVPNGTWCALRMD